MKIKIKEIFKKKAVVFAIVAVMVAGTSLPVLADWSPGDGHKMHHPQLPDEAGWDVYATAGLSDYGYPEVCLADDWMCTESGNVTDIHFWGSWKGNITGIINGFQIAIHKDIPANESSTGYSMPGTTLWERTFEHWDFVPIDPPSDEGWYNPYWGEIIYDDHSNYFQYNIIDIIEPFYQIEGTIYWLSISAIVAYEPTGLQPLWGWKSTENHWNDDACWAEWGVLDWIDLWEPSPPITNQYWIAMDPLGNPDPDPMHTGGTDYYNKTGTHINGWYYYQYTNWWNIWFYDHPFNDTRIKEIFTSFNLRKYDPDPQLESYVEVAVNWATDYWEPGGPPPIPPYDEPYIARDILLAGYNLEGFYEFFYEILDYNPEWVSIDVRGQNFVIENGWIEHACLQSLDLAFVITGEQPGEADVEIEKTVWDPTLEEWVEEIDAAVGETVSFKIDVHNNGDYNLTNIVVTDTLPVCLEYVTGSADPVPSSVHGNIITWDFPGPLSYCNTITIYFDADVVSEGENINVADVTADADDGTIVAAHDTAIVNAYDPGEWYWKPDYPNYAPHTPGGMPDFSQYQDLWQRIDPGPNGVLDSTVAGDDVNNGINIAPGPNCHLESDQVGDDVIKWAFCGPVAVANCFWWFDSKYADPTGTPGDGEDTFPLVEGYGVGDDHSSANVPYLIEDLAGKMQTTVKGTTDINLMQDAIDQWFIDKNLDQMFTETTYYAPEFEFIEAEIERSQDVILLLGFYDYEKLVDQEQTLYDTCVDIPPFPPGHVQSFVPTVSVLDAVKLLLQCNYPTPSTVDVTIYDALPTLPGAMALGTSSMVISGGIWDATWYQFHFDPSITLIPGRPYFIAVQAYTMDWNIHWCYNMNAAGDSYPQGMAYFCWSAGSLEPSDYDFAFKTEYYNYEECIRTDGHYVTCAGVNSDAFKIAFSDPALNISNPAFVDHNDPANVSHDIYDVLIGSPCPSSYMWWLPGYPSGHMYTIVEQAVVICPQPSVEVDKWVWDPTLEEWVEEIDAKVGEQVLFKIEVHNNGGYDLTNIVVTDTLPVCLEYAAGSANPAPTSVHGNIITWNFPGPLSYCETITMTFYAEVVSEGVNINEVNVTAEAYPYPADPVIVTDDDTAIVNGLPAGQSSVDIEKWVWDPLEGWVKYTEVSLGATVRFKIDVHNDGGPDLFDILVTDFLPDCLQYADNAIPKEPDDIVPVPGGTILYWYFPGPLPYCTHIIIEFDAIAVSLGKNTNEACVKANSTGGSVYECSWATVFVNPGIPPEITNVAMTTSTPLDTVSPYGWENVTCTVRDPAHGVKMHYPQMPDPFGWDVLATFPAVLADDWRCTETGPVTDIHFWGSWLSNMEGTIDGFWVSIHADIPDPDGPGPLYSMPGPLLWERYIRAFEVIPMMEPSLQGWYDPYWPWYEYPDHNMYFQYDIVDIPSPFIQEEGTIYWLNICANVIGPGYPELPLWGWKTSMDHWNDDAVWALLGEYHWIEMYEPPDFITSLDLAFVITGEYDEVDEVKLVFVNDEDIIKGIYPMIKASGNDYYCNVTVSPGDEYSYYVWADDTSDNQNTSVPQPFNLSMNWDVDMNGQTYFADLIAIVMMYGDTGPGYPSPSSFGWVREDVDNNGWVYFSDLIAVVMHYGEYWK